MAIMERAWARSRKVILGKALRRGVLVMLGAAAMGFAARVVAQDINTETIEYNDNLSKWVVGQVKRTTTNGIETGRTAFDPTYAVPTTSHAFGKLQQTLTYDTASAASTGQRGTLKTVADGRGNVTTLTLWKRGVPGKVTYPATTDQPTAVSQSAVVNDDGTIAQVTDENGFVTKYGYDAMGRLSLIDYPDGDTVPWTSTNRTFSVTAAIYGLPQHWRLWERTGNGYKVTHYDALWRPVVEDTYDYGNVASTRSIVVKRYDEAGRLKFQSYPMASLGNYTDTTLKGIDYTYDALDRIETAVQHSELGPLTTTTEYLSGFQTRVTNPRGYVSTSGFQVYDSPDSAMLAWTVRDAGYGNDQTIQIDRDAFGKPTRIRQFGSTWGIMADRSRYYVYDELQQLCKTVEPETGVTAMGYDGAGNLLWSAAGLDYPSTTDCNASEAWSSGRRVERSYDARNRLKTLLFPDGRGNQAWNYTADGLPSKIVTYNEPNGTMPVENTYTYNRRRLMVAETTAQSWYTWAIGYGYHVNGYLASQVSPTTLTLAFLPNALGQPTVVQDQWGGVYASGIKYHPNGALAQFTYGNGITHTMQQNARQLPQRSTDNWGAVDYEYAYDDNGNPTLITDYARGADYSRWLVYDGLDRLTDAGSCSFGGDCWHRFDYDALDNLKSWKLAGVKDYANYYYDATNRLIVIQNTAGASTVGFGYDEQGNLQNKNGQGYDFDYGNRLRTVYNKEFYRYDGYGRRAMSWRQPDFTNLSMYSHGGQLVYQSDESKAKSFDYVHLSGSLIATIEYQHSNWASTVKFQHTDALGSPVAVTNSAGVVLERTAWEPYGAAIGKPAYDGVGYSGHVMDGATKLTYMQQRYYDPGIGMFLSVDPVAANMKTGGNFNRYRYANDNPYEFTDPDGRFPGGCGGTLCDEYERFGRLCEMTCVAEGAGSKKPKQEKQVESHADLPSLPERTYSSGPGLGRSVGESWERTWRARPEHQGWIDVNKDIVRNVPIEMAVSEIGKRGSFLGIVMGAAINMALPDNAIQYRHTSVWGMQYQLGYRHAFTVVENGAAIEARDVQMGYGTIWVNEFQWRAVSGQEPVTRTNWDLVW
jgi:RHS repeat-associated protein